MQGFPGGCGMPGQCPREPRSLLKQSRGSKGAVLVQVHAAGVRGQCALGAQVFWHSCSEEHRSLAKRYDYCFCFCF